LTISVNILSVGEFGEGEEGASQPHRHQGELLEEAGRGMRNLTAKDFTKVPQQ
jgi:hypothetical protein